MNAAATSPGKNRRPPLSTTGGPLLIATGGGRLPPRHPHVKPRRPCQPRKICSPPTPTVGEGFFSPQEIANEKQI